MKILMVLTSHDQLGNTGRKTGFWLEEFAAPYYTFKDASAEIVLASPKGGQPPLDPKSNEPNFQTELTRRFEADADAQARLARTVRLDSVKAEYFDTVFYPGGHGPMWDLAEDENSIRAAGILFGSRQDLRVGLPFFWRVAPCQEAGRQAARSGQDRDRLHQWRGRRGKIDEGSTLPCRGRTDEPRCHLFQSQELGRSHGCRRSADHRPESGLVGPGCQTSDRYAEQEGQVAQPSAVHSAYQPRMIRSLLAN